MRRVADLHDRLLALAPIRAREGGVVFAGDIFSKFLTFLITILLFKLVSPADYKLYGVFITLLATLNQFTDSGLHQSFIRFFALHYRVDPDKAAAYLRFSYRVKWGMVVGTSIVVFAFAEFIAIRLLRTPELVAPTRLLCIGLVGNGMFEFIQAVFQARQHFKKLTMLRVSEGFGKLAFIAVAIPLGMFSLRTVYLAYIVVPTLIALWGVLVAKPDERRPTGVHWRAIAGDMFQFGKWMMLTSFATMFLMRIDVFMISGLLANDSTESGLYIAAARLCTPFIVLAGSVGTIFFPKAMELRSLAQMKEYVAKSFRVTIPLTVLSLCYLGVMVLVVPHHFPNYTGALPLFAVLTIGYLWTILGNPLTVLVLSINRARVVTFISATQLVFTIASHYWFITHMGAMGAALSTVIIWFLAGTVSTTYLYRNRHAIDHIE